MVNLYVTPNQYFYRIHQVRSRFKNDVESVLGYVSSQICALGKEKDDVFKIKLDDAIRRFPGNALLAPKTIANWRTEISSLFGLVQPEEGFFQGTPLAQFLAEEQDLIAFFRHFLLKFQYPGAHIKPEQVLRMIETGIRFHPTKFLIELLIEGQNSTDNNRFGISKEEATHLIWNDLRVTRDQEKPGSTVQRILFNRKIKATYDSTGDVVRQAGDVLDYLVLADLLVREPNGRYYLKPENIPVAIKIRDSAMIFSGYESFYGKTNLSTADMSEIQNEWFEFAGKLEDIDLSPDPLALLEAIAGDSGVEEAQGALASLLLEPLRAKLGQGAKIATKDIGNAGESIVLAHEQKRLMEMGMSKLSKKVTKIPDYLGIGYDILSFTGLAELQKFIEVKTSVSHGEVFLGQCHLTPPEWGSAETNKDSYFVFRVMISTKSVRCFVIQNPVAKYKSDVLNMTVRNGADLSYTESAGFWEELLV